MQYKWIVISNTTVAILMASLDTNIVIIALPRIVSDLHASMIQTIWIVLSYGLVTASVLLSFGRLADMFGRVKLYNFGLVLFTISSFLCSFSQNGFELILLRMVQALGAAFLFSNSTAIITDAFQAGERGKALGLNQISIVIGSVLGLLLGGILTESLGWRSIFWVNVPIGTFAAVWARIKLRELGTVVGGRIDWLGNVVFVTSLVLIMLSITLSSLQMINIDYAILLLVSGFILIALFGFIESKIREPMFRLSLFKIKFFTAGNMTVFLNALARGAVVLVMSLYLQGPTMRLGPLAVGLYLIPISFTIATFGPISGLLYDRYGSRILTIVGLVVSAMGFLLLSQIQQKADFTTLLLPLALIGSGMGIFAAPNRSAIMNSVPPDQRGVAAGMSTTMLTIGNVLSLGMSFAILTTTVPINELESIFLGNNATTSINIVSNFLSSIHVIFYISMLVLLVSIIPAVMEGKEKRIQH